MPFQINTSIGYQDVFDDYDTVNLKKLIVDIPTKNALEIIGYFIVQLHTIEEDHSKQIDFLSIWLDRLPNSIHDRVNSFIKRITSKPYSNFNFINNVSCLLFIEELIENENQLESVENLTPSQELNLFKAYLFCSEQWIKNQLPGFDKSENLDEENFVSIFLATQLPFYEILEFKDFRIQFIKAKYFFEFCQSDIQFQKYLKIFLNEYHLSSWENYLANIVKVYIRKFERLKTPSVIHVTGEYPDIFSFLEQLCIDTNKFKKSKDFLPFREKPIYKISETDFLFLNLNFLVDKIYQAIQFDFAKVLVKNSASFNERIIKSTVAFLSIFGDKFSETGLFYRVMNYAFEKSGYVRFSGEEIKEIIKNGEPDYYIRDKAKIYLFEFKNIFLSAEVKNSFDYEKIKSEIFKKLVVNQEDSPKGVTQLVNSIEKMKRKEFEKFDQHHIESTIIYPIIIYVDLSFNVPGINYILNKEFKKQLHERKIQNPENIQDLILIDLDTFIKFQDLFRNKNLKLNNCCNEFYKFLKKSGDLSDRISTFNMFIHNKTDKLNHNSPNMFMNEIMSLISAESN